MIRKISKNILVAVLVQGLLPIAPLAFAQQEFMVDKMERADKVMLQRRIHGADKNPYTLAVPGIAEPNLLSMPVNIWGAVQRTGLVQVPIRSDLVTVISQSGGPAPLAKLNEVTIKRRSHEKEEIIHVNLEKVMQEPGVRSPIVEANDIIFIPTREPVINQDVVTVLGVVSSLMAIILTSYILSRTIKGQQ